MTFKETVIRQTGRLSFVLKKYSPEILVGAGVVGIVGTAVLASSATLKLEDTLDKTKKDMEEAKSLRTDENHPDYVEGKYLHDMTILYVRGASKVAKLYLPTAIVGAGSVACVLAAMNLLNKRNAALAAAYSVVDASFREYRKRVVAELGEEKDREFMYGGSHEHNKFEITDESGKKTKVETSTFNPDQPSGYGVWFSAETSRDFSPVRDANLMKLRGQENRFNEQLHRVGYVFLNDVYLALGMEKTRAGQVVGWRAVPGAYIDFGVYDRDSENNGEWVLKRFQHADSAEIFLDFNVDGYILEETPLPEI